MKQAVFSLFLLGFFASEGRAQIGLAPNITVQPSNQTVLKGGTVSFVVVASSLTSMSYKWYRDGSLVSGATASTYTITNAQPAQAGVYRVDVANLVGTTPSSNANLTVLAPPSITTQPQSQTVTQGMTASLSVVATGTAPLSYRWKYLGTYLAGATNATLSLTNVQLVQGGNYSVTVTNPWGASASSVALLTVIPPPGSNQPLSTGLVVHLTFDTDLADSSGRGNHGAPVGAPNIVPGFIGSGGMNPFTSLTNQNYVTLGTNADLLFGASADFTIAFWARQPVGSWAGGSYFDPVFIANKDWSWGGNTGWVVNAESPSATGAANLWLNYTEAFPNTRKDYHSPAGSFGGDTDWHHLAVTFNRGGNAVTYIDGVMINATSLGVGGTTLNSGLPTNIGNDGTGNYASQYGYWTNAFGIATNGLALDDLGIWRRVLSPQEVCAIYNVGLDNREFATVTSSDLTLVVHPRITQQPISSSNVPAGSTVIFFVAASGTAPFAYQWLRNGTPVAGGQGAFLILSNAQPAQAGSYSVVVTNSGGKATSAVATLTINLPPVAFADAYAAAQNVPLSVPAPGVLGNDTDVDSTNLTAVLVSTVAHGSLALKADGSFIYTPASNYFGSDSFTYRASDGSPNSTTATVTLAVRLTTPLIITPLGLAPDGFRLQLSGPSLAVYTVLASENTRDWTPISTNVAFTGRVVLTDGRAASLSKVFYAATVGAQATTVLEKQGTNDGTSYAIQSGKKGAQSFKHGTNGGPAYTLSQVVFALSRTPSALTTNLYFSIGTGINSVPLPGSSVTIDPASITNATSGASFQTYEITFASPVGPLLAGTTYYLNLEYEPASALSKIFIAVTGDGTAYSRGTYYRDGSSQSADAQFELWGQ